MCVQHGVVWSPGLGWIKSICRQAGGDIFHRPHHHWHQTTTTIPRLEFARVVAAILCPARVGTEGFSAGHPVMLAMQ